MHAIGTRTGLLCAYAGAPFLCLTMNDVQSAVVKELTVQVEIETFNVGVVFATVDRSHLCNMTEGVMRGQIDQMTVRTARIPWAVRIMKTKTDCRSRVLPVVARQLVVAHQGNVEQVSDYLFVFVRYRTHGT